MRRPTELGEDESIPSEAARWALEWIGTPEARRVQAIRALAGTTGSALAPGDLGWGPARGQVRPPGISDYTKSESNLTREASTPSL